MKIVITKSLNVCLVLAFYAMLCVSPGRSETSKGYILNQKTKDLGPITVSACKKALRIDFDAHGCTLISHEPDWEVYMYRADEKVIWVGNIYDVYPGKLGNLGRVADFDESHPHLKVKITPVQGWIDAKRARVIKTGTFQGYATQTLSSTNNTESKEIQCLTDLSVDPHCGGIMCNLSEVTPLDQMPVLVKSVKVQASHTYAQEHRIDKEMAYSLSHTLHEQLDLRTGPQLLLSTTKIRTADLPDALFTIPQNYKSVRTAPAVMFSHDAREKGLEILIGK